MEGSTSEHFQNENKDLEFEPLNSNGDEILHVMNADVLSQEVQNLALKDSMNGNGGPMKSKDVKHRRKHFYPLRPHVDNCHFFMKFGRCKFGANCRYNHPFNRRSLANKEIMKPKEGNCNRTGQVECKGEKECTQYWRNGSCKYGLNCWFDHSEPSSMGGGFPLPGYSGFEGTMPCWSAGPINEIGLFEPPYMYQPAQCAPYSEWIGYQVPLEQHKAPVYTTPGESRSTPPETSMNTPASDLQHQQRELVKESSEPNVQPECNFKFGFGSHHPKTSPCPLNDKGLPLRPDTEVCTFFDLYGVCKHGPACKFDHPITLGKSVPAEGSEEAQLPDPTTEDKN